MGHPPRSRLAWLLAVQVGGEGPAPPTGAGSPPPSAHCPLWQTRPNLLTTGLFSRLAVLGLQVCIILFADIADVFGIVLYCRYRTPVARRGSPAGGARPLSRSPLADELHLSRDGYS